MSEPVQPRNVNYRSALTEKAWRRQREAGAFVSMITLTGVLFCLLFSMSTWWDAIGDTWDVADLPISIVILVCSIAALLVPIATGVANRRALQARRAGLPLSRARRLATGSVWLATVGTVVCLGLGGVQLVGNASPGRYDDVVVNGAIVLNLLPCLLVLLVAAKTRSGIASADRIARPPR